MGELESRDRWTGDERTRYYPVPLEGTVEGATGRATVAAREVATQELYLESGCSLSSLWYQPFHTCPLHTCTSHMEGKSAI
jgi:non-canonical (house-cleaning) NTP pyrophosphatase